MILYTIVLKAGMGSTMVYTIFEIFSSRSGISSSFIPVIFLSLSATPIMIDPPPLFAKAQAVFAIESGVGIDSLNSRVLLSDEDRRFWMDIDYQHFCNSRINATFLL